LFLPSLNESQPTWNIAQHARPRLQFPAAQKRREERQGKKKKEEEKREEEGKGERERKEKRQEKRKSTTLLLTWATPFTAKLLEIVTLCTGAISPSPPTLCHIGIKFLPLPLPISLCWAHWDTNDLGKGLIPNLAVATLLILLAPLT
jgi:hypothetical protein